MYLPIKPDSRQLFLFEGIIKKVINFPWIKSFSQNGFAFGC